MLLGYSFWSVSVLKEVGYEKEGFWEAKHLDCPWYTVVMPM
jgi:hypothetical protein